MMSLTYGRLEYGDSYPVNDELKIYIRYIYNEQGRRSFIHVEHVFSLRPCTSYKHVDTNFECTKSLLSMIHPVNAVKQKPTFQLPFRNTSCLPAGQTGLIPSVTQVVILSISHSYDLHRPWQLSFDRILLFPLSCWQIAPQRPSRSHLLERDATWPQPRVRCRGEGPTSTNYRRLPPTHGWSQAVITTMVSWSLLCPSLHV
jgi:hypothetical protein